MSPSNWINSLLETKKERSFSQEPIPLFLSNVTSQWYRYLICDRVSKGKSKAPYFTLLTSKSHPLTDKPEVDVALILLAPPHPPSSRHQYSVLQVFKATQSFTERKGVETRIWGHTWESNSKLSNRRPPTSRTVGQCAAFGARGPKFDPRWHHIFVSTSLLSM